MVGKLVHGNGASGLAANEKILIEIFQYRMLTANRATSSAPGPMAFEAIGTFQFTPPAKFDGKKENVEEFAFKLRAYIFLVEFGI